MVEALVPSLEILQDLPCGPKYIAARNNLVRKRNARANTALHEALLNSREMVARYLIQQDPETSYYHNHKSESALYLAAKAGFASCVSLIPELCTDQLHMFKEKSPIIAAIQKDRTGNFPVFQPIRMQYVVYYIIY